MMTRREAVGVLGPAALLRGQSSGPIRVVIAGLVHGHAGGFFRRFRDRREFQVVGIVESRREVAGRYAKQFGFDAALFHTDLDAALAALKPEAVMAFSDTFDHQRIVESCAKRGVHVMVEKPLAVSVDHARAIERASRSGKIHVLVNYETTWYPSVHQVRAMRTEIGSLRKLVIRDGHQGPKEIGVQPEFLEWLTDPVRNGAGALFDFGCYGANLATWLMDGERPRTVTAVAQSNKPEVYAKVDDEATIVLSYAKAQAIIQGSWNWPYSRKDLDVYGAGGYVLAPDRENLVARRGKDAEEKLKAPPLANDERDEVAYFAAVIRGKIAPSGLSSLENNLVVTEILDAARRSVRTGATVRLLR